MKAQNHPYPAWQLVKADYLEDMERPNPSSIPLSPGVYIYRDARERVIYVGKARILRRRVLSYFRKEGLPAKTRAMIAKAASIEFMTTTTEKEALLLEANLIKKYRPHYNIVLRDDKNYFLFRVNLKKPFPRLEIVRRHKRDGAKYFGPFTSALAARETWRLLHRAFPIRRCREKAMKNRVRPCLYHYMGQCPAPCMGEASHDEYMKSMRKVCEILSGNAEPVLQEMRKEMELAADVLDFERAATLRDRIKAVEKTVERQAAVLPGAEDMDVIGMFQAEKGLAVGIIFLRNGQVSDGRAFYWPALEYDDAPELLATFLNQYYFQAQPPPRILLPFIPVEFEEKDEENPEETRRQLLEQSLSERREGAVRIVGPQNDRDNQLVDLARANAREEARRKRDLDINSLLERVGRVLGLGSPPLRIECVDVSHTGGKQTRVGMVVYTDGLPYKEDYRVYAMPDSDDDYATLHDWIERRLESGPPWPDLLLIDGGRGQLSSVAKALEEAGQSGLFQIASIAKARDENGHADRRAGNVSDRIFLPGRSNPLPLREGSPELLFLQQIRDATHNFAIGRHRQARRGAAFSSGELMRLPGIGPVTARLLWDKFGSVEKMTGATEEDLRSIPGIGKAKAASLAEKLRKLA